MARNASPPPPQEKSLTGWRNAGWDRPASTQTSRDRRDTTLRRSIENSVLGLPSWLHCRRLCGVSTAARLDCLEICDVGCRHEDADAIGERPRALSLRR